MLKKDMMNLRYEKLGDVAKCVSPVGLTVITAFCYKF